VLYVKFGRPSIPPERLPLKALYTIRSERQLIEQIDYNLLFRRFVGLGMDDAVWAPTTFTKNRDRLLEAGTSPGPSSTRCCCTPTPNGCCRTSTEREPRRHDRIIAWQ